jgi:N-acetylglucosaminyl-diphospho-decaprenol L-rhamnosyltransferase
LPAPDGSAAEPPIVVAVVSWNTRDLLARCLASLAAEVDDGAAEVWVVDNGSTDGSPALVREHFPWARLLEPGSNLGFGPAVNEVARRTRSEWIVPANADIELTRGALARLAAAGARYSRAAVVAPRLELPDGSTQHSAYAFPTLPFTVLFNLGVQRLWPALGDRMCLEGFWDSSRSRTVDWAVGAFLLVRREAFDAVGGFDASQWMFAEDLDLGWRLSQAGWQTRHEPGATVIHHESAATGAAWGEERTARWLTSTYAWMLRRRGATRTRIVALVNVVGAVGRAVGFAPLARIAPARWGRLPGFFGSWARLHWRAGLAPSSALRRHR